MLQLEAFSVCQFRRLSIGGLRSVTASHHLDPLEQVPNPVSIHHPQKPAAIQARQSLFLLDFALSFHTSCPPLS